MVLLLALCRNSNYFRRYGSVRKTRQPHFTGFWLGSYPANQSHRQNRASPPRTSSLVRIAKREKKVSAPQQFI